ncbi:GNAT family N-acetyltransferase [Prescottella equi]|uniref:GNAT family N-acetyltransferase n=1 Tax=Rhodococcus hoagii TaxID=43767 RepID=UPI0007CD5C74|nr:GNAT family N-acetyltransferase [Prescottella equi]
MPELRGYTVPVGSFDAALPDIVLRVLGPDDRDAVRRLHERLSQSDAHLRFLGPRPNHLDALARTICRRDIAHYALGAFDDGVLVGVANYVLVDARRGRASADIALVVEGHEQRHGIGTMLIRSLGEAAIERGVVHLTAEILAENTLMLAVIDEQGWSHALHPDGTVVHFDLDLRAP